MKLIKNIDKTGRLIRLGIGILLLAYAYWQMSWLALIVALFIFFESACSWCIVKQFLGKKK